ncbi:hypothetical protein [Cypionkella sp.]|uniref:hypothetical protein n=1 Tax=Cypionkella sp. TaxID=2811411 RepID=UPI002ABC996A|nr:hypothetical protein [Cypionkella sp.]MDZ4392503.1 hypothetical protein [Cypionkella sp.]
MIENSDRGITLAKPFAWTILASIVGVVWYGGGVIAGLSGSTQAVTAALTTMQAANVQIEGRVRALENSAAAGLARYDALKQSLDEVKDQQRETNDLLRQILQGAKR